MDGWGRDRTQQNRSTRDGILEMEYVWTSEDKMYAIQSTGWASDIFICGSICVVICSSVHILMGNCNNFRMSCRRAFVMGAPVKAEFWQCIRRDVGGWMDHQATESFLVAIDGRGCGCNGDRLLPWTECWTAIIRK